MNQNIIFYSQHANVLYTQYESTSFESVHADWLHLLPKTGKVLDIGAGSGRDSAFMAKLGLEVYAVEPADNLRLLGTKNHIYPNLTWLDDTLPNLNAVTALNKKFDLILLSAVWMHLSEHERKTTLPVLCWLLSPKGTIIITLRHGKSGDERVMHPVSVDEIKTLLAQSNFVCELLTKHQHNADTLGREAVTWQAVQITAKDQQQ